MQYTGYSTYLGVKLTNIASGLTGATGLEKQIEDNFGDFTTKNNTYTTRNGEQDEYLSALETKAGNLETGATGLENRNSTLNNDYISIQNRQSALITGLTGTAGSTGLEERSTGFSNKIIAINNKLNGEIQEAINTKVADSIFNALTDEFGEAFEEFQTQLNQKVVTATQEALDARQDGDDAVLEKKFCSVEEFVQSFQQTYIIKKTDNSIYNFDGKIQKLDKAQPIFTIIEYTQNPEVSSTWDLKIKMTDYGYNVMTGDLVVKKGDSNSGTIVNTLTKSDFDATTKLYTLSLLDSNSSGSLINGPYTFEYRTSTGKVVYDLTLDSITDESVSNNSIEILGDAVWGRWIGGSGTEQGLGISAVVDANGISTVYVTGYATAALLTTSGLSPDILTSMGTKPGITDAFVIKYDSSGNAVWARWIGGTGSKYGYGISATIDTNGVSAVYVTGYSNGALTAVPGLSSAVLTDMGTKPSTGTDQDAFVIKYDSSGNAVWGRWIGGSGTEQGSGISATTDAVYITGSATGALLTVSGLSPDILTSMGTKPGSTDTFVIKYDSFGTAVWARWIGGSGSEEGSGISATTDSNGTDTVYVTGYATGALKAVPGFSSTVLTDMGTKPSTGTGRDAFVIKYDSSGNAVWARWIGGTGTEQSSGISSTIDTNGVSAVYVTGYATGALLTTSGLTSAVLTDMGTKPGMVGNQDAFVIKYDSSGTAVWARWIGGDWIEFGRGTSSTIDTNGVSTVYVTGYATAALLTTSGLSPEVITAMGTKPGMVGNQDAFVIKYDSSGTAVFARWIGGTGNEQGSGISATTAGLYVTGYAANTLQTTSGLTSEVITNMGTKPGSTSMDAFVIKYI